MQKNYKNVSVVIATYNNAQYIRQAIDSVLQQTCPVHEIIIVNDGSTDNTRDVVLSYGDRVVYLETDRAGPARARNAGIRKAGGDLIAFLDSDDYWLPDKIEKQLAVLDRDEQIGLVCGKMINFDNEHPERQKVVPERVYSGMVFDRLLQESFIGLPTVIVRKSVIDDIGLFNENLLTAEDTNFYLRLTRKYKVHALEEPVIYRRLHGGNISERFDIKVGTLDCLDDIAGRFPELSPDQYVPMRQAYEVRGRQLLLDSFNAGQYAATHRFARNLMVRKILFRQALMMFMLTLLPGRLIDGLRSVRRMT